MSHWRVYGAALERGKLAIAGCASCQTQKRKKGWYASFEYIETKTLIGYYFMYILVAIFGWHSLAFSIFADVKPCGNSHVCSLKCARLELKAAEQEFYLRTLPQNPV